MSQRPTYVGVGECACGRIDVQLYLIPGAPLSTGAVCSPCLEVRGYVAPKARTADDIVDVDGKLAWKAGEPLVHVGQLDLGNGHFFESVLDTDGQLAGWRHAHIDARSTTGALCQSFCAVKAIYGAPVHQVICVEPLTLTPSLLCRACGAHGHVTNGKWEPC